MELKYYLRGLGLGIAITAVIMGIATSKSKAMTNEEIIARAKELGMTEDNAVLTDINSDNEDEGLPVDESGELGTESDQTGVEAEESGQTDAEDNSMMEDAENRVLKDGEDMSGIGTTDSEEDIEDTDSEEDTEDTDLYEEFLANNPRGSTRTTDTGTDAEAGELNTESSGRRGTVLNDPVVITIGRGDGSYSVSKKLEDVGVVASAKDFDTYLCQNGYDKRIRTGTYTIPADASDEQLARIITGKE